MSESIDLQPSADIDLEPAGGGAFLVVKIKPGVYAKLADLGALGGANLIGWDRNDVADEDSVAEGVLEALTAKRDIVSQTGHVTVTLVNDGTALQLLLAQPIGFANTPQFAGITVGTLEGSVNTMTVEEVGAGAGPTATEGSFIIEGVSWCMKVQLTVSGVPTGTSPLNIVKLNFGRTFVGTPQVVMIPANRAAFALQDEAATACVVGSITTTSFILQGGLTTPLTNGTVYQWYFLVIGA